MQIDKALVKRVLIITLSNVGDIVLTTAVVRAIGKEYPSARLDVMVGPEGKEIFEKDPRITKLIIYDKHTSIAQKRRLQIKLKKLSYDLIVDLRNTIFPLLLGPKFRTATIQSFPKDVTHRKQRHLYRLQSLGIDNLKEPSYIHVTPEDISHVEHLLKNTSAKGPIVVINPGAKSHLKRWGPEGFAQVADKLVSDCGASVIFIGRAEDSEQVLAVTAKMKNRSTNFVGKTNIRQLAALLGKARLLITNDSAPLHVGCAIGTKVLAIFGPTDPDKYGPTGEFDVVVCAKLFCSPCEKAVCVQHHECMKLVPTDEVFETAKLMLEGYAEE